MSRILLFGILFLRFHVSNVPYGISKASHICLSVFTPSTPFILAKTASKFSIFIPFLNFWLYNT
nr:MAG TPA: hypothetical protein [Bacteriophage sp.]